MLLQEGLPDREIDQISSYYATFSADLYRFTNINQPLADLIHRHIPDSPKDYLGYVGLALPAIHRDTWLQFCEAAADINLQNPSKKIMISYLSPVSDNLTHIGFTLTAKYNQKDGNLLGYVVLGQDITEKTVKDCREFIEYRDVQLRATHDGLTGLHNYRYYVDRSKEIANSRERVAVGFFDLDRFKLINDTYGHPYGDQYLKDVAGFLRLQFRAEDVLARYGGDEFIVILVGESLRKSTLLDKKESIREELHKLNLLREQAGLIPIRMSFDLVVAKKCLKNKKKWDMAQALIDVDQAMYRNKGQT